MKASKTPAPKKQKKLIVANWKMNPETPREAALWVEVVRRSMPKKHNAKPVACPSDMHLGLLSVKKAKLAFQWGVQSVSQFEGGSHTGESSAALAKKMGASYAIVGHSERRELGESDEVVARKASLCLEQKLTPIVCIGETSRDDMGMYLGLLKKQLLGSLAGIPKARIPEVVIAYEPVYAIGAKKALEPSDIIQMALYIKKALIDTYGPAAGTCPVLYGGSVTAESAGAIMSEGGVDGLLVGRASWDPKSFCQIIAAA
jgi:triosephosphate isomerase